MAVTIAKERWTNKVAEVVLGTEPNIVKIGGESTLPFLHFEGEMPNRPAVALEVWDMEPTNWPEILTSAYAGVLNDPVAWAKKCVEYGADLVCLTMVSAHPDNKNTSPEECAQVAKAVADAVNVPLIILGCGIEEKDAQVLEKVAENLSGRNFLLGCATQENYKTITAACIVHGHNIIASSPLDINLEKQLNILITEMNLAANRIIIDPSVGALGYGIEYAYSIMERTRIGALTGDKMMAMPVICLLGQEVWKTKEAKSTTEEAPEWGNQERRAILWEVTTAVAFAQAGGSLFVMRHPESLKQFRAHIDKLMQSNTY
ncbi:acetyl-CoA decarbonylase/synthase complex subunit delta [Desulfofundulus thermosubterraneus]|uniref:CO-methylating acetyl-CoA synthase corrinoid iron-sulfur protein small subunit /acetyl-CoA decarbonylase/synthase delta subunit n=1 Tax=Desulfofundulus thermosubterraneus DSM 16057 TaxID=1121432 RepID=A0A1M6DMW6_9FIRM|nr:acetyl-CoA decarbonylase/synthase complex subunit delta [Desulfofundulus thermosubterraneus]SHI74542.1 CO-methylating acetyl-CoA synthase corrinoid iron-sulfur protein small subunit precursor /acetyl-CoA decarbonylase/synthase delta subunit [Desulfofundulus thermosubterraneus DSM 16057]